MEIFTLALLFAYPDVVVVRRLVAVRQARVALEVVVQAHEILGAHLLAAQLPQRQPTGDRGNHDVTTTTTTRTTLGRQEKTPLSSIRSTDVPYLFSND